MMLAEGQDVAIDVFMFEVGQENPFVDNLARLVKYGFVDCPVEGCPGFAHAKPVSASKQPGAAAPSTAFPGRLAVKFYYQFQSHCPRPGSCATTTHRYLTTPVTGGSPGYSMTVRRVWQGFAASAMRGNPDAPFTPQDMHLKVAAMTAGQQVRLYVATSNLDMPDQGSGKKWQAGNVIETGGDDGLYRLYQREFRSIAEDGDLSQSRLARSNAAGNSYFDRSPRGPCSSRSC